MTTAEVSTLPETVAREDFQAAYDVRHDQPGHIAESTANKSKRLRRLGAVATILALTSIPVAFAGKHKSNEVESDIQGEQIYVAAFAPSGKVIDIAGVEKIINDALHKLQD